MIPTLLIQFFVAVFATLGFAIVFHAPMKELHLCGFTGAVGWIVYFLLYSYTDLGPVGASMIASVVLTIFARIFAVRRYNPVTVYLLTGIFPLVPGAGIYYSAYYLISGDRAAFGSKGTETLEIALAIVFGIIFGTAIPQVVFNRLFGARQAETSSKK